MNATKIVAGGSAGSAAGLALVHFAGHFGLAMNAEDGAWLALSIAAACAFVVHNGGLLGVARIMLRGMPSLPVRTKRPTATKSAAATK